MRPVPPRRLHPLASVLLGALLACGPSGGGPQGASGPGGGGPPPPTVGLHEVAASSVTDVVDLVGQLEAEESVEIRSEVDGVIASVGFEEGQEVEAGQVLFRLRDDEQQARLHEAEADLALAADVHRRTAELAGRNITAAAQLDRARAELGAARARVELARVELDRTRIRAPFDGVLGDRRVSPGDRVTTETALVRLEAVARLQLAFVVPEVAVPLARVGREVALTTAPFPGEEFSGRVFFVAPSLDPATRRLLLKAWVPNPERRLRPGLFANVRLELGRREGALMVPEESVVYDPQGAYVWRVDDQDRAERVPVELGVQRSGRVEITRGLAPGDRIVSAGTHKVSQGTQVRPAGPAVAEPPPREEDAAPPVGGL